MTLRLSHNGSEWHGTFGVVARTLITDLLSDGKPFNATIAVGDGGGKVTGSVLEITRRDEITVDTPDGRTVYIKLDDVEAIDVP